MGRGAEKNSSGSVAYQRSDTSSSSRRSEQASAVRDDTSISSRTRSQSTSQLEGAVNCLDSITQYTRWSFSLSRADLEHHDEAVSGSAGWYCVMTSLCPP